MLRPPATGLRSNERRTSLATGFGSAPAIGEGRDPAPRARLSLGSLGIGTGSAGREIQPGGQPLAPGAPASRGPVGRRWVTHGSMPAPTAMSLPHASTPALPCERSASLVAVDLARARVRSGACEIFSGLDPSAA